MFNKKTRKELLELNTLRFTKDESSNPSGRWNRWKNQLNTEINDAVLLYQKLPLQKKNELYNLQTFKKLLDILLDEGELNPTKIELADYCVRKSIKIFTKKFKSANPSTPALSSVINDYLDKASDICQDISYRERRSEMNRKFPVEDNRYLFTWDDVTKREKGRLTNYLSHVLNILVDEIKLIQYHRRNSIKGTIKDIHDLNYSIEITRDIARKKAKLIIQNNEGFSVEKLFDMKPDNGKHLVYYEKSDQELLQEFGVNLN